MLSSGSATPIERAASHPPSPGTTGPGAVYSTFLLAPEHVLC